MNKKKVIVLCGPAASGKDFFAKYLKNNGMIKAKDYTTRPKRKNEQEEYVFVSDIPQEDIYYVFEVAEKPEWKYGY